MVLKERDFVLERVDKSLSSVYWADVNLRSGLYSATLRGPVADLQVRTSSSSSMTMTTGGGG